MFIFHPQDTGNLPTSRREDSDAKQYLYVKSESGLDGDTPGVVQHYDDGTHRGYFATAMLDTVAGSITSYAAYVGVPDEKEGSIGAGSFGWMQVEGKRDNVQFGAGLVTGSPGHACIWSIAAVGAAGSAYVGGQNQFGTLATTYAASTTANIFLTGKLCAGTS